MAATNAQQGRLYTTTVTSDSDDTPRAAGWTKIAQVVSLEAALPIRGDIESTNLDSTSMEFIDDVYEELTMPVTVQSDLTQAAHKTLLSSQAAKTKRHFLLELPEGSANPRKVTTVRYFGWVRNYRWTGTPRAVQQASFDILTREAAVVAHNIAARA